MGYALTITVDRPVGAVLAQVRSALSDQGFDILRAALVRLSMERLVLSLA